MAALEAIKEYLTLVCREISHRDKEADYEADELTFNLVRDSQINKLALPIYQGQIRDAGYLIQLYQETVSDLQRAIDALGCTSLVTNPTIWDEANAVLISLQTPPPTVRKAPIAKKDQRQSNERLRAVIAEKQRVIMFAMEIIEGDAILILLDHYEKFNSLSVQLLEMLNDPELAKSAGTDAGTIGGVGEQFRAVCTDIKAFLANHEIDF